MRRKRNDESWRKLGIKGQRRVQNSAATGQVIHQQVESHSFSLS